MVGLGALRNVSEVSMAVKASRNSANVAGFSAMMGLGVEDISNSFGACGSYRVPDGAGLFVCRGHSPLTPPVYYLSNRLSIGYKYRIIQVWPVAGHKR